MSEIIVGRYRGRYLTAKDQQFVLVASPTGGDKGVGMVLPNLLNYPDSVVNFDLKGENFRYTSLFRQRCGQQVYLWAPFAEDGRTHRWNMLDAIARDSLFRVGDILAIGQSFYPSDCHPKDKYWNDNARNLFLGLVLYLMETPELPCTLGEVFRQSSGGGKPVKQHLEDILTSRRTSSRPLSPECVDAFNRFQSASSESVGNIISTFNAPLLIFANPIVDAATSHSDFDLGQVRRRRMSIYLSIPPHRLSDAGILANLFFSQLIDLNTRQLPENDLTLKFECLLALDELAAIGKLGILARSNFYIRGYGLRLMSNLQSVAQAVGLYGEADARTLLADHTIHIAYPPADQAEAEELSKILGYLGQSVVSTSNSSTAGGSSHSENRAEHARALMLPQELRTMPRHQQIVLPRYCRPILCDKARYYEDHRFIDRLKSVSPTLAALDRHGWRRAAHTLGAGPWCKVYPTEAQIKHAAFVLRELSVEVPRVPMISRPPAGTIHQPPSPRQTRPVLPVFKDAEAPTPEEANAIVAAFFAQLPLFDTDGDSAAEAAEPETATVNPANAARQAASSAPGAGAAQAGNGYAGIDLSALDP
ncbi:type IV secretory system conjugative DNA transfer family protein [Duganella sp. FT109W]|uniref:Type IV secretory system conjugative DNA transfer family protein n=1 Tax=Duganella margarita TaxID=2692170 RepID=A0ABW9WJ51_9BURK|nr:type IV secretory system conjugative DNA transfer family protein [Duganella margarita]MYN40354.1 type IV secretory system conjugative DNA transfer family protein [Duganella margarita]